MKYGNYKKVIADCMEVLNGRVNTLVKCHSYSFDFIDHDERLATSDPSRGIISFNLVAISKYLDHMSDHDAVEYCIRCIAHELSHLDQDIDQNRYVIDPEYKSWIERTNDNRAIEFLIDNRNMVFNLIGNYTFESYMGIYQNVKAHGSGYKRVTIGDTINRSISSYLLPKYRGKRYDTIIVSINDLDGTNNISRLVIKNGTNYIDPNILFPIICWLDKYKKFILSNSTPMDGVLNIKIQTEDKHKNLETIIYKVKAQDAQYSA